jgi:AraC-like DNA-binding protein
LTSFAKYYYLAFTLVILALLVFVIKVVLATMKSPDLFTVADEKPVPSARPSSALVEEDDRQRILEKVLHHMAAQRPFLEPELTLDQLASQLSIRPKILSHVINERLNQNFFDFVNRYRIEEARRLLTNPPDKKITILEVLYEVGFNSKSSFNTLV